MLKGIYTKAQSLFEMFEIKVNKSKADLTDLVNAYHSARFVVPKFAVSRSC